MSKLTYKIKIIILLAVFGLFVAGMFSFGYDILGSSNQSLTDGAAQRRLEYEVLQREQKSFEQGKKDLATLEEKEYPPNELFSKDTKVVKEIELLEQAAAKYGVTLTLNISGSVKTAPKVAGVTGELFLVPYVVNLNGSFENVMRYIQASEHLPFVTYTRIVNFNAQQDGTVNVILNSDFYIKK